MLQKHVTSNFIHPISNQELQTMFGEVVQLITDAKTVYDDLHAFKDGELEDFELADELELYTNVQIDNVAHFHSWKSSKDDMVNRYLDRIYLTIRNYGSNLSHAVDCAFQITDKEFDALENNAYSIISSMSFFLVAEFGLDVYVANHAEDDDIDEIFNEYCKSTWKEPADLAKWAVDLTEQFRLKIDLFDAHPEYEDLFFAAMGPDMIAVNPELLTIEMVAKVVTGAISSEELVALLKEEEEKLSEEI